MEVHFRFTFCFYPYTYIMAWYNPVSDSTMSGSGKGLLGLWLYRNGSEWQVKNEAPPHPPKLAEIQAAQQQTQHETSERISVIFTLKNQVGGLVRALSVFQDLGINVLHIESRKSMTEMSSVSFP